MQERSRPTATSMKYDRSPPQQFSEDKIVINGRNIVQSRSAVNAAVSPPTRWIAGTSRHFDL